MLDSVAHGFQLEFFYRTRSTEILAWCCSSEHKLVAGSRPVPPLSSEGGPAVVYAVNGTQIRLIQSDFNVRAGKLQRELEGKGLTVHEESVAGLIRGPLGVRVDGQSGLV